MKTSIITAILLALTATSVSGCVSATVSEPSACVSSSIGDVPVSPVLGVSLPPTSFSVNQDFSDILKKVDDVANQVNTSITQLTISSSGNLQWVNEVDVSVSAEGLPDAPLASYTANGSDPGNNINMQVKMSGDDVVKYLSHPVVLTFTLSGMAPDHDNTLSNTTCLELEGKFSKSL